MSARAPLYLPAAHVSQARATTVPSLYRPASQLELKSQWVLAQVDVQGMNYTASVQSSILSNLSLGVPTLLRLNYHALAAVALV